jgi:hypothetical protein
LEAAERAEVDRNSGGGPVDSTLVFTPKRRRIVVELIGMVAIFAVAYALAVHTEYWVDPPWVERTRWGVWPALLLFPVLIVRVFRLLFCRWAIRIQGDLVESRASLLRDFSFRLGDVRGSVVAGETWHAYTRVELIDGRRYVFVDRYVRLPDGMDLPAILRAAQNP